jgi:hypothetical protein
MVKHLLPDTPLQFGPIPEVTWQQLRREVVRREVHWDEQQQEYAFSSEKQ